jgi:Ca2+-binding RTX toxin-like protein
MAGDELDGGGGNDVLIGGRNSGFSPAFRDEMTGGTGADRFVFSSSLDSPSAASADIIHDFSHAEGDKIDLHGIDANLSKPGNQAFTFLGVHAITGRGQLVLQDSGDGGFFVLGNVVGDTTFDFIIKVENVASLVKGDFIL